MRANRRYAVIFAGVAAIIVATSLVPLPAGPDDGPRQDPFPPATDKVVHAVGYAVAAYTLAGALGARRATRLAWVVAAVTLLGAGVELAQGAVPGRTTSALDGVANAVGAVVGVAWWRRRGGSGDAEPAGERRRGDESTPHDPVEDDPTGDDLTDDDPADDETG